MFIISSINNSGTKTKTNYMAKEINFGPAAGTTGAGHNSLSVFPYLAGGETVVVLVGVPLTTTAGVEAATFSTSTSPGAAVAPFL